MIASIVEMFNYGFMQNAYIVAFFIGLVIPLIGIVIFMRRMGFIADSLGHINMSGIAFAMFMTATFSVLSPYSLLLTMTWTILGALLIEYLRTKFENYKEVSIMIVYSLAVAMTILFLNLSTGYNAGLFNILFGNINTISDTQVKLISLLSIVVILIFTKLYRSLFLLGLEEDYIKMYGIKVRRLRYFSIVLITVVISMAIKVVGVLLVSSLLLIPLLAAIRLANNLKQTIILSIIITEFSLFSGIFISYYINISASAIIVLTSLLIYLLSVIFKRSA